LIQKGQAEIMLGKRVVDAQLRQSLGLTMRKIKPVLSAGGDLAESQFMHCCRSLWKADGVELVEPFVDATFNWLPDKSRSVLFQRMLTIVYVAQDQTGEVADRKTSKLNPSRRSRAKKRRVTKKIRVAKRRSRQ
jgi:hypothetical protein